jgi:hypothetical protein
VNSQFPASPHRGTTRIGRFDIAAVASILVLGAFQLKWCPNFGDFIYDAYYYELAHSILTHGFYGFDHRFETLYPPGFPLILVGISKVFGATQLVFARSMVVFFTLSLLASYFLLRAEIGRTVAACFCLLLATSPDIYAFSTQVAFSDLPYLFFSVVCLILGLRLAAAEATRSKVILGILFALALAASLLIRTSALAILGALFAWSAATFLRYGISGGRWRWRFLPAIVLGTVIFLAWSRWSSAHYVSEWQLSGWPDSYFAQVRLKVGNNPEMGKAGLGDVISRVERNSLGSAELLARFIVHKAWKREWYSPVSISALLLILVGFSRSMKRSRFGLLEWYFAGYEAMFLLWPWDIEMRFQLPIVPVACIYLWRGIEILSELAKRRAFTAAALMAFAGASLSIVAWHQSQVYFVFWVAIAILSVLVTYRARSHPNVVRDAFAFGTSRILEFRSRALSPLSVSVILVMLVLCATGVIAQRATARSSMAVEPTHGVYRPDIEAALWVRANGKPDDVVMARKLDLVCHYSQDHVVWFPPISRPETLMDGISKYHVLWLIVTSKEHDYFRPGEQECLASLLEKYPDNFRLAHAGSNYRIFSVRPSTTTN